MASKRKLVSAKGNKTLFDLGLTKKKKSTGSKVELEKQYDQKKILSKLEESKNLLKEMEDDFEDDEFENLLAMPGKTEKETEEADFVELSNRQLGKLSELELINYQLQKNAVKLKEESKKCEDLNVFLADKEEEERMDTLRRLQEPGVVIHDVMGYNAFFNLPFVKLDMAKLDSILNVNSSRKQASLDLANFLFQIQDSEGEVLYNSYTEENVKSSFMERRQIYDKFETWLWDLTKLKPKQEHTILLKTVSLLQVLFVLATDFYHNNTKFQTNLNDCFNINSCFLFIEKKAPLIMNKLNTVTTQELESMNFFSTFLNSAVVNDYHIQLFLSLDRIPSNIVARFKEVYYCGDDFEAFVKQNVLIHSENNTAFTKQRDNILALNTSALETSENGKNSLLQRSIENLKSCEKMEEQELLTTIRAFRIKNFFLKKEKTDSLFRQLHFMLAIIGGSDIKHYKYLAKWVREELHKRKTDTFKALSGEKDDISLTSVAETIDKDANQKDFDDGSDALDGHMTADYYGFSKECLPDVYIKRYLESILVTCDCSEKGGDKETMF